MIFENSRLSTRRNYIAVDDDIQVNGYGDIKFGFIDFRLRSEVEHPKKLSDEYGIVGKESCECGTSICSIEFYTDEPEVNMQGAVGMSVFPFNVMLEI